MENKLEYKKEGHCILRADESFRPYMGIDRALKEGYELSDEELLALFQDRLRRSLQIYINGQHLTNGFWFEKKGLTLLRNVSFPFLRRFNIMEPAKDFFSPLRLPLELIKGLYKGSIGGRAGRILEKLSGGNKSIFAGLRAADLIAECYGLLEELLGREGLSGKQRDVTVLRRFDASLYEKHSLQNVIRMQSKVSKSLNSHILGFYLHGSLSTLDFTPFSDADAVYIVKKEVTQSGQRLKELSDLSLDLSAFFYEHDWLQHHRHFVVTEYDLEWYNPAYLPPEVFECSTAFFGPEKLSFYARSPNFSALEHLWGCLQRLRRDSMQNFNCVTNIWKLKDLVSLVLFLPVLYLGAQEKFCYKKYSFDKAKPDFSDDEWKAVEIATRLRAEWKPFNADEKYLRLRDMFKFCVIKTKYLKRKFAGKFHYFAIFLLVNRLFTVWNIRHHYDRMTVCLYC